MVENNVIDNDGVIFDRSVITCLAAMDDLESIQLVVKNGIRVNEKMILAVAWFANDQIIEYLESVYCGDV